jgi:hypothetical protein
VPDFTPYAKAIIAALFAAATAAQTVAIAGGFTTAAILAIITAALGAFSTYAWPNAPIIQPQQGDPHG